MKNDDFNDNRMKMIGKIDVSIEITKVQRYDYTIGCFRGVKWEITLKYSHLTIRFTIGVFYVFNRDFIFLVWVDVDVLYRFPVT